MIKSIIGTVLFCLAEIVMAHPAIAQTAGESDSFGPADFGPQQFSIPPKITPMLDSVDRLLYDSPIRRRVAIDVGNLTAGEPKIKNSRTGTEQVVNDNPVPAYQGRGQQPADPSHPVAGSNPPPGSCGMATNDNANFFAERFPSSFDAVAAIVGSQGGVSTLEGTAFVLEHGVVVTARHVADLMAVAVNPNGVSETTESGFYLVFDLKAGEYPNGFPAGIDWSKNPNAIPIPANTVLNRDAQFDIASFEVKVLQPHGYLALAPMFPPLSSELAEVGVPGQPDGTDQIDPRSNTNYQICGSPALTFDSARPVTLRIGTGVLLGGSSATGAIEFAINTLGGDSGAPIFDASSGLVVGMNVGTPQTIAPYNLGVGVGVVASASLASVPSP